MSTLSLGARAKISGFVRYAEAMPILVQIFEQIEVWSKKIGADNLDTSAVTTPKLADGAVTAVKTADGVGKIASGTYVGDGATANRVVALTFTPKYVVVLRTDATPITFETISSSGDTRSFYRAANGTYGNSTTHWQGAVSSGFKLGTSATGDSNIGGVTYSYVAFG